MDDRIRKLRIYIESDLQWLCAAHDFYHIDRVQKLAEYILNQEGGGNIPVVQAGALCHEFFDEKFFSQQELICRNETLPKSLQNCGFSHEEIETILFIAKNVWYGKSLERTKDFPNTREFSSVEDADRLEAIGAIAIARTFTFGWKRNRAIYDPSESPRILTDQKSYHEWSPSSINHFYEKLLSLKDTLHTDSAREIAKTRHEFMELFLKQFYLEWNLEDLNV